MLLVGALISLDSVKIRLCTCALWNMKEVGSRVVDTPER